MCINTTNKFEYREGNRMERKIAILSENIGIYKEKNLKNSRNSLPFRQ